METKSEIKKRIDLLRDLMTREQMDGYLVVSDDFHGSEYVGDFFKERAYMSGFTGSAGVLVVLRDQAALWTDGRYFIQAEEQLRGTGITLMKQGLKDVPSLSDYLLAKLQEGSVLGMDGRTITVRRLKELKEKLEKKAITCKTDQDLVGQIWQDRPDMSHKPAWILKEALSGKSAAAKISEIRKQMQQQEIQGYLMASLDDIGWLCNLRGADVECTPVALAYVLIDPEKVTLYLQKESLIDPVENYLMRNGIELADYFAIYEDLRDYAYENIYFDPDKVNVRLLEQLPQAVKTMEGQDLTALSKAKKNAVELAGERMAHVRDGVALTRFLYWLKTHVGNETITEISGAKKLEQFRRAQDGYLMPSFEPIFGYAEHGAIVHYSATEETDASLHQEGFLLMDTGAHYDVGTTDVTRTVALGPVTERMKRHYTAVLIGHLALLNCKFPYGTTGTNLDAIAREPLWKLGLDFRHGTGHGVGHILSVHEGPQNISQKWNQIPLEEGMVISDEPGYYETGAYGIRIENLMVVARDEESEYGQFFHFEPLTLCPYDRASIDETMLSDVDKKRLNAYHKRVYEMVSPYLKEEERMWLENETKPVSSHSDG